MLRPRFIIGSSGQVAQSLAHELRGHGIPFWTTTSKRDAVKKDCRYLDLGDRKSISKAFEDFESIFPGKDVEVYLTGALTHVDRCEQEPALCRALNVEGPKAIAEECATRGYRLAFFSSEYVYGGAEYAGGAIGPFRESDPPQPTSVYGQSKLDAENAILSLSPSFYPLVIRTTMVFSWAPTGMNFFMQLFRHLEQCQKGAPDRIFKIPVDQISTPTYAPALAHATFELMEKHESGVFHIVGKDLLSRKDFLAKVIKYFSFAPDLMDRGFEFLNTSQLGQAARRPLTAGLRTDRAEKCGIKIWSIEEAFQHLRNQQKK